LTRAILGAKIVSRSVVIETQFVQWSIATCDFCAKVLFRSVLFKTQFVQWSIATCDLERKFYSAACFLKRSLSNGALPRAI
jgi:hypothetical protein